MKSALWLSLMVSCAWAQAPTSQPVAPPASQPMDHHHHALPGADPPTRESLYQLELPLTDQRGQATTLTVFRGRPVIISMFFASCTAVCPLIVSDIQRFEKTLTAEERARLGVVLVSFDPENDGPATFATLIERHQLDGERWRLATASADDVRLLSAALGIRYTKDPKAGYVHSAVVTLLNPAGEVVARTEGVLQPVDGLVEAFRALPRPGEK